GGAGGIGRGMAMAFVKEGAKGVIVDLNETAGEEAVKELQEYVPDSMFIQQDLTKHDELAGVVKQVGDKYGQIDILVNNAHASKMSSIEETTQKEMDLSFNTGVYPTFYFMQAALPYLKASKGNIINFSSGARLEADPNHGPHVAPNEGMRRISRVAANVFREQGITEKPSLQITKSKGKLACAEENPEYYDK